jgi:hypothetical protein
LLSSFLLLSSSLLSSAVAAEATEASAADSGPSSSLLSSSSVAKEEPVDSGLLKSSEAQEDQELVELQEQVQRQLHCPKHGESSSLRSELQRSLCLPPLSVFGSHVGFVHSLVRSFAGSFIRSIDRKSLRLILWQSPPRSPTLCLLLLLRRRCLHLPREERERDQHRRPPSSHRFRVRAAALRHHLPPMAAEEPRRPLLMEQRLLLRLLPRTAAVGPPMRPDPGSFPCPPPLLRW